MQFIIADAQIVYKLQIYIKFLFAIYKDNNKIKISKSIRVLTNKTFIEIQKNKICKHINRLNKINIYTYQ